MKSFWRPGVVCLLLAAARAQDTRKVTEPVIPRVCATLKAELIAPQGIHAEDESKLDTARLQQGLDGCGEGHALELAADGEHDAFLTGPIEMRQGVTLLVDKGVTMYGSRNPADYELAPGSCGINDSKTGCKALITGRGVRGAGIMGDGVIDGRGGSKIIVGGKEQGKTWWDLGHAAKTGLHQQVPRLIVMDRSDDFTLYRITLNNSPNFHVVPSGIDGLTVWSVKVQTPTLAAFANPAGNGNPLYNGQTFNADNVKNTDAFDPGSASRPISAALSTGSTTASASPVSFDGYLKNVVFAYNYVSTGDDDIALKGGNNPSPAGSQLPGIDGNRDVRADRKWGIAIAHNHIYWGHGISIGSETNGGVTNVQVYDNSFQDSEEGLRIKSDYARGGEVSQIHYANICIRDAKNALLFTPYYSTKAVPAGGPLYPNFHDISLANVAIFGEAGVKLQGFEANTGGYGEPAFPLAMTLTDVVADSPDSISVIASDANLTLHNVNLPIFASTANRVVVDGTATHNARPANVVDCSKAFVDFPGIDQSNPFGTTWAPSL